MRYAGRLACLVALLGACAPGGRAPPPASPGAPSAAPPPAVQRLTVAFSSVSFAQIALPVAQETGIFERNGLAVDLVLGPNGLPALIAGEVQMAVASAEDAALARLGGADVVMVGVLVPYLQHKFMVRPEIQTAADLRDRPVGVSKRGTLTHTVARLAAKRGGLDPERDLTIIELGGVDKALAALTAGSIYGSSFSPPNTDLAEQQGAHVLYDFRAERIEYPAAVVIVLREWADRHEGAVIAFLRSLAEAVQRVHTQPDEVAAVFARWAKTGDEAGRAAVVQAHEAVALKMLPTAEGIRRVLETVADQVPAAATAEPTRFFDDRYIQRLEQEGLYARLAVP
jgi:NitT/TauT family transport system substrate-binding protein